MKLPSINTISTIIIAAGVGFLLNSQFQCNRGKTYEMGKRDAELEQLRIRYAADSVRWDKREVFYDSALSASNDRLQELENKKQPIYNAIKTTKSTVFDYDKEQLRGAVIHH